MKLFAVTFLLAGSLLAQGPAATWEKSLDAAKARAKAEHKLIFMDVWTGWCGWCLKLQKDTFPSPEAQAVLAKVVPVSLMTQERNGTPTADNHLEKDYKIEGFPALFLLDAEGRVVSMQPGYLPPEQFAGWINETLNKRK